MWHRCHILMSREQFSEIKLHKNYSGNASVSHHILWLRFIRRNMPANSGKKTQKCKEAACSNTSFHLLEWVTVCVAFLWPRLLSSLSLDKLKSCSTSECPSHKGRSSLQYGKGKSRPLCWCGLLSVSLFFPPPLMASLTTTMTDPFSLFSPSCCDDEPCCLPSIFFCWEFSRVGDENVLTKDWNINFTYFKETKIFLTFTCFCVFIRGVQCILSLCAQHVLYNVGFAMIETNCALVLNSVRVCVCVTRHSTGN